jgi:hypothetical protein
LQQPITRPYEKGYALLKYLQAAVGEAAFDDFLRAYVKRFRLKTLQAEEMFAFFLAHFPDHQGLATRDGLSFDTWLNVGGMPPVAPDLSAANALTDPLDALAEQWAQPQPPAVADAGAGTWRCRQTVYFLDKLIALPSFGHMADLDAAYRFSENANAEIRFRWCMLSIKNEFAPGYATLRTFLHAQGKQKVHFSFLSFYFFFNGGFFSLKKRKEKKSSAKAHRD